MSRREADPSEDATRATLSRATLIDPSLFDAPGSTCAALRGVDWTQTELGPPERWPADLRRAAHTVVRAAAPMLLWWGEHFLQLHNDAVIESLGGGPAVAQPAARCWSQRWEVFAPHARRVIETGERYAVDEVVVPLDADAATSWAMSFAPLHDCDGRRAGVLVNAVDLSARVTAHAIERRDADALTANLQVALSTNRRIGIAIGILMAHLRITDAAAFDLLREASQRRHRKLREVADDVVLTGTLPD